MTTMASLSAAERRRWVGAMVVFVPVVLSCMPLGIFLSHSIYSATAQVAVTSLLALLLFLSPTQLSASLTHSPPLWTLVLWPALATARYLIISRHDQQLHSQTRYERLILTLQCALLSGVELLVSLAIIDASRRTLQASSMWLVSFDGPMVLLLPFAIACLNLLSIHWTPTSSEAAHEAEAALLRSSGLEAIGAKAARVAGIRFTYLPRINEEAVAEEKQLDAHESSSLLQKGATATGLLMHRSSSGVVSSSTHRTALILLHGYSAASGFFFPSMPYYSKFYDVYSLDLLGFGLSHHEPFKANSTPHEAEMYFVRSLETWRIAMRIDHMILLGHSLGGFLAVSYAINYPKAAKALILVSPVGIPESPAVVDFPPRGPAFLKHIRPLIRVLWNLGLNPSSFLHFAGLFGPFLVSKVVAARFGRINKDFAPPEMANYLYHMNAHKGTGLRSLNSLIMPGAYARLPLAARMKEQLNVPTMIMYGDSDWMRPRGTIVDDIIRALRERGVRAEFDVITQSAHQIPIENPKQYEQKSMQFAAEISQ